MNKATISIALSMCLLSSVSKGAVNKEMLERNLGSLDLCYAEYEAVSATQTNEIRFVYSRGNYCLFSILGDKGDRLSTVYVASTYPDGSPKTSLLFFEGNKGSQADISDMLTMPIHPMYRYYKVCQIANLITTNDTLNPIINISLSETRLNLGLAAGFSSNMLSSAWLSGFNNENITNENEETITFSSGGHTVEVDIETGIPVRDEFPVDGKERSIKLKEFNTSSVPENYALAISESDSLDIHPAAKHEFNKISLNLYGAYLNRALSNIDDSFIETHSEVIADEAELCGRAYVMQLSNSPEKGALINQVHDLVGNNDENQNLMSLKKNLSIVLGRKLTHDQRQLDDLYWKNFKEKPDVAEDIFTIWQSGFVSGMVNGFIEFAGIKEE